jgi:hypothetical protein
VIRKGTNFTLNCIISILSPQCLQVLINASFYFGFREEYETVRTAYIEKGRSRHSKVETFSPEQLQASFLEYQEDAALFIFRLKSLKQGQFLSILTQAARHHAAQVRELFFTENY